MTNEEIAKAVENIHAGGAEHTNIGGAGDSEFFRLVIESHRISLHDENVTFTSEIQNPREALELATLLVAWYNYKTDDNVIIAFDRR